jgi:sulfatase modifying factor 1
MKPSALYWLTACGLLLACGGQTGKTLPPIGQIKLYVATDAPLPAGPDKPVDPNEPPALFDRLRIDVFAPEASEACAGCSNEWELDRMGLEDASIGIVPPPGVGGYVARARLFRGITLKGGEPPQLSTIDVYVALPPVNREGISKQTIVLRVQDLGHPVGSLSEPGSTLEGDPCVALRGESCEAPPGQPAPPAIDPWPAAARVACPGSPRPGEACVPGGAFWMGHPDVGFNDDGSDATETRLVVVSPFYVDLQEVTVAEYRASGLAKLEAGSSVDPALGPPEVPPPPETAGALTPNDPQFFCDYSDAAFSPKNSRESLALNCVSWEAASAYCASLGKALPSEAEFEYMASGLRSDLFVWGQDDPDCDDSVWGDGGVGYYFNAPQKCRPPDSLGGPKAPGSGRLDRLPLNGGDVLDLMGNLNEWTRDYWNRTSEACWAEKSLLENPVCASASAIDGDQRTVKGFSWGSQPKLAAIRYAAPPAMPTEQTQTGFRCVRAAR